MTGSGTIGDPYIISTPTDLDDVRDHLSSYYELGNNIDMAAWGNFVPIADFLGHFDGKNYAIDNLTVDIADYAGLFSWVCDGATLANIYLTNVDITGMTYIGGLIGAADTSVTITNCHVQGTIADGDDHGDIGGLIGSFCEGLIEDCDVDVTIFSVGFYGVGGLIGWLDYFDTIGPTVRRCHAEGSITDSHGAHAVGGLIGWCGDALIEDCWADVDINNPDGDYTGGFVGWYDCGNTTYNWGHIKHCYALGDVIAYDNMAGFAGALWCSVYECYALGNVTASGGSGFASAGGFVNVADWYWHDTDLTDCYAKGIVDMSAISSSSIYGVGGFVGINASDVASEAIVRCYSTGLVIVPEEADDYGGFCGANLSNIIDCFWDTETSGQALSDGGTGKTTAEMKTKSTFTGSNWDFDIIWNIY